MDGLLVVVVVVLEAGHGLMDSHDFRVESIAVLFVDFDFFDKVVGIGE